MRSPLALAFLTAGVMGIAPIPTNAANAADGDCVVTASLPARATISAHVMDLTATVSDTADCMDFSSWYVVRSDGARMNSFDARRSGEASFGLISNRDGDEGGPGTYHATYSLGISNAEEELSASSSGVMVAKFASSARITSVARVNGFTTLTATARRFTYTNGHLGNEGWGAWRGAHVFIQQLHGSVWTNVRSTTTDRRGKLIVRVKANRGVWRAVVAETRDTWSATSPRRRD